MILLVFTSPKGSREEAGRPETGPKAGQDRPKIGPRDRQEGPNDRPEQRKRPRGREEGLGARQEAAERAHKAAEGAREAGRARGIVRSRAQSCAVGTTVRRRGGLWREHFEDFDNFDDVGTDLERLAPVDSHGGGGSKTLTVQHRRPRESATDSRRRPLRTDGQGRPAGEETIGKGYDVLVGGVLGVPGGSGGRGVGENQ